MCLIALTDTPQIATQDIICWKIVYITDKLGTPQWRSPIIDNKKIYDFNKQYKAKFDFFDWFHEHFCRWTTKYSGFFHSYNNRALAELYRMPWQSIIECHIPKGTKYYEGTNNEYASRYLIADRIVTYIG